jgi:streptogrisin C
MTAALVMPSGANANPSLGSAELAPADMVSTVARDLGLTNVEAQARLAADFDASALEAELRGSLDDATLGGAWIEDGGLVVAITDRAAAADVLAAGAQPRLVAHSEAALETVMTGLNSASTPDHAEIYGWAVDVQSNSVVVQAAPGAEAVAAAWVEESGLDGAPVRIETSTEAPRIFPDIIGGQAYFPGNSRCSVGFSVNPRGLATAGHCGGVGTSVRGVNGQAMGTVQRSVFPGSDMGYVAANTSWVPRPWVSQYNGSNWVVRSSNVAAIGAVTCRSGSTTGVHCGNITHRNQTVNYPQGSVFGLTRTTVCAEPGDSGGSFVASGISAQGVTSGGSGNCTFGGITFFEPINAILSSFGLSLVTG